MLNDFQTSKTSLDFEEYKMNLLIFRTRRIGEKIEEKAVYQFLTDQELERIQKVGNIFNLVFSLL